MGKGVAVLFKKQFGGVSALKAQGILMDSVLYPVFAPAQMNWASIRMYNTHKRVILYVLYYGLILAVWGLLYKHPLGQTLIVSRVYREVWK